ncbi:ABC transporter permease [Streptomyces sp. NPDC047928]|uniref:ABC transporter permease n=1 Tax=unclassified Streptomyces TaxID=2593676 RepID=UPI00370FA307
MTTRTRAAKGSARPETEGSAGPETTTAIGRMASLGRAEFTLLIRNRTALFVALLMPLLMIASLRGSLDRIGADETGMSVTEGVMTGGIGMILILVVYLNLVSAYVGRREELVLKRLRTGEATDREILAGTALPSSAVALAQCVLMVAAAVLFLDMTAPRRPEVFVAGVLVGTVLLTALAALTAAITRTVESAQLTTMPLFLVSAFGSGLFIPLQMLPERVAQVGEVLPLTGVMTLVRAGWLGFSGDDTEDLAIAAVTALAWTVISVFAVRRWFRWEPRR